MKARKFLLFASTIALLMSGCTKTPDIIIGSLPPSRDSYLLCIGIKDASGKDLVAPLGDEKWKPERDQSRWAGEINPDKYSLDIIMSNLSEMKTDSRPYLTMAKLDDNYNHIEEGEGYWYLFNEANCPGKYGIQESLNYILSCSTIFGSDRDYEIETWWNNNPQAADYSKDRKTGTFYPECMKATFDGKSVSVTKIKPNADDLFYFYVIDIVLDK